MPLTIALSGMDNATETALRAAFAGANAQLGERFAMVAEPEAEHVVVDMDSMYGPMSWLRLHAAGKQIVGLTSAPRVQTHFRLGRPFDDGAMAALLREIATTQDITLDARTPEPVLEAGSPVEMSDAASAPVATDAGRTPPERDDTPRLSVVEAPVRTGTGQEAAEDPDVAPQVPDVPPAAVGTPAPEHARSFAAWLDAGVLHGRRRYRSETGPTLWLDFDAQQYFGPSTLKPLTQYFDLPIEPDALETVDDTTWSREVAGAGTPQPLSRLVWLGGLLAGDGTGIPDHDPDARFQLNKWPQTEREYPRHFRIATAMMKGPSTLEAIIAASGLPAEEVVRFVNANLATGYATPFVEPPVAVEPNERTGGFFARLRGR